MSDAVVRLESVEKHYRLFDSPGDRLREALHPLGKQFHTKFYALRELDLVVLRGEVLGVVGRNGSGKSTLLKVVSGLLQPSAGAVTTLGKISPVADLGSSLNPDFTGVENVRFRVSLLSDEDREGRVDKICAFADLGEFLSQPVSTYSSGMKARLGFAIAMSEDPDILLLDEVLAVGDLQFRRKCFAQISSMIEAGKTVLLVSHDPQVIVQYCSRAILVDDGSIVANGSPKSVIDAYQHLLFANGSSPDGVEGANRPKPARSHQPKRFPTDPKVVNQHVAAIESVTLKDQCGKELASLEQGAKYSLHFQIQFRKDCYSVSIGAQIRTISGLLISGANMQDFQQQTIPCVREGEEVVVEWSFRCELTPGAYCVRIFATSESEYDTVIMDDALIFKVEPVSKLNGGYVNLDQEIEFVVRRI